MKLEIVRTRKEVVGAYASAVRRSQTIKVWQGVFERLSMEQTLRLLLHEFAHLQSSGRHGKSFQIQLSKVRGSRWANCCGPYRWEDDQG